MATVRIEYEDFNNLSHIPPLGDARYVTNYTRAVIYAKVSFWPGEGGYILSADHYENGVMHCYKSYGNHQIVSGEAASYDASVSFLENMKHVTDKPIGSIPTDTTELRLYSAGRISYHESNKPYLELDYDLVPITVTTPTVSAFSKDRPFTLTWVHGGSPQYEYEIKYTHNGNETIVKVQSDAQSHTFAAGTFPEGSISYQIRLSNGFIKSDWTTEKTFTTYSHKVTSLEPNGVAQFKDAPITATWESSDPQTQYEFKYTKNGVYQPTITGTTTKVHLFPKDTFGVETVTMQLRTHNGYVWSDWKTVSFVTFGTPLTPALTTLVTYATAFPRITWTSQGQVGYQLQLLKDGNLAIDSGEVVNVNKYHDIESPLQNNTSYTARLRIRNQYGYWSTWTSKTFTVAFAELQKPTLSAFSNASISAIVLDINNIDDAQFKECEIYRRSTGEWTRIAKGLPKTVRYTDYSVRSDVLYEYYARAISTLGGFKDGDKTNAKVNVYQVQMLNVATKEVIELSLAPKIEESIKREVVRRKFHGRVAESKAFGDSKYKIVTAKGDALKEEKIQLENMDDTAIWLLRNDDGFKLYGTISNLSYSPMLGQVHNISFQFDQANYSEEV